MARPKADDGAENTEPVPDGNTVLANALLQALQTIAPQQPGGISKEDLKELLAGNAAGIRQALKPENPTHPDISAFNPEGERDHPRPKLRHRKTYWAGTLLFEDELSREEIELFNSFTHTTEARNGSWRAELRRTATDGSQELHVLFPCVSTDDRMDLPSMKAMLRELLGGQKAVDPDALADRVAQLEKQLAGTTAA